MKQFNGPPARKENINETAETNKESHWPSVGYFGQYLVILWLMALKKRNYRIMAMLKFFTYWVLELMI